MKEEERRRFDDELFAPVRHGDPDSVSADVAAREVEDFMKLSGEVR